MAFLDVVWAGGSYFLTLLGYWLSLFFMTPFENLEVLWILLPIWLNLIVSDFYQEKHGTALGNAITNGVTIVWVGLDWIRFMLRSTDAFSGVLFLKIGLCIMLVGGGIFIMVQGIRGKGIAHLVGRVRETSYVMLVLCPLIYNIIEPSWNYFLSIVLFFPLFYGIFEAIDRALPDPRSYPEDQKLSTLTEQKF